MISIENRFKGWLKGQGPQPPLGTWLMAAAPATAEAMGYSGFDFLVAVIGLFGVGEILLTIEEGLAFKGKTAKISPTVVWQTWKILPRYWATLLRSSVIGCWLGITPGGAIAASFMGYNLAKRFAKDNETFGTGRIEGVFAPETAAHASGTSYCRRDETSAANASDARE